MDKIKVLFISDAGDKRGAQKSLVELMITLKENFNVVPVLLTKRKNKLNEICTSLGIENYSAWYRYIMMSSPYNIKAINICKHSIAYIIYLLGSIAKYNINNIGLDYSKIDLIHTNTNRVDIGCYLHNKYNIPHIMHIRELGVEDFGNISYHKNVYKYFNKNVDRFIAISNCVKNGWIKRGIDAHKVNVIYNGLKVVSYERNNLLTEKEIRIVVAGAINKYKGQFDVIKALTLLPKEVLDKTTVTLFGDGKFDYIRLIKNYIKDKKLSKYVILKGYSDNLALELKNYNVGIVCSKAEAFGRVTVEYMLSGLCIIASNTGANIELIEDGINGLLYEYGSPGSIAECIKKVYVGDTNIQEMRKNASSDALKKYTTQINAKNIRELYDKLLDKK